MTFALNPQALSLLDAQVKKVEDGMAREGRDFLREKLAGPGGGLQHPFLPNRSSVPGEYPAEQSGDLLKSIDARGNAFGAFDAPPQAFELEFPSPPNSPAKRATDHGARPWLSKALADAELHDRLRERAEQEAGT